MTTKEKKTVLDLLKKELAGQQAIMENPLKSAADKRIASARIYRIEERIRVISNDD